MSYPSQGPPLRIVPASQFVRQQQQQQHLYAQDPLYPWSSGNYYIGNPGFSSVPGPSNGPPLQAVHLPENVIYYMGMTSGGYIHEPYGQNAYIDASYGANTLYPPYAAYSSQPTYGAPYAAFSRTGNAYGGASGAVPSSSSSYLAYPQPSPPHRRSRTAPSRTLPRNSSIYPTTQRQPRGISHDADRRPYRAYAAPGTRPAQMYKKRKDPSNRLSYQETSFGGPSVTDYSLHTMGRPYGGEPMGLGGPSNSGVPHVVGRSMQRTRAIYTPSYTTYPPSTMANLQGEMDDEKSKKYPIYARATMKGAELLLGAAILGLVLGPMRATTFIDFVTRTRTEWQGVVVGVVAAFAIATAILFFTSFFGHNNSIWRKIDAHVSVLAVFLYLVVSCIEAYFAACYPPNGARINLVCHRAEWIIATVLCFINVILYVIDFIFAWLSGVTML